MFIGFLHSFLCLPPLFPFPSCHHLPLFLFILSSQLTWVFLYITISSDCFPSLSSFLRASPHLSLFATLHASPPFSPVSSLLLFLPITVPLCSSLPGYSYCYITLFPFFPNILFLFTFPLLLSLCPSSRSWIISGQIQCCLCRWHSHIRTHSQKYQLPNGADYKQHHKQCFLSLSFPSLSYEPFCHLSFLE